LIAIHAAFRAVEPPAHAFSTLVMGMPARPLADNATWPRMQCWKEEIPHDELENHAASMSARDSPQSLSARSRASPVSALMPVSRYLPNLIIPTPTMYTSSLMVNLLSRSVF